MVATRDGRIWMLAQNYLLVYDANESVRESSTNIFPDIQYPITGTDGGRITAYDSSLLLASDGLIYGTIRQKYFFSIDPKNAVTAVIFEGAVYHVAEDGDGNLYTIHDANRLLRHVPAKK